LIVLKHKRQSPFRAFRVALNSVSVARLHLIVPDNGHIANGCVHLCPSFY